MIRLYVGLLALLMLSLLLSCAPAILVDEPAKQPTQQPTPTQSAALPTPIPTLKPTQKPQPTPEPSPTEVPLPLAGKIIGIDPGHQKKANSEQEPVAPGSSQTKNKVSSGTQGRFTKVPEYQVNLDVGLLLRDKLMDAGATVVMTRETNDVNISNVERAQFFNENNTDYALRLHCNGNNNQEVHGAFMLCPKVNPFLQDCKRASELMIQSYCASTGAKNLGVTIRSDQTGFNWCERMIVNIEMGHMTNQTEDNNLTNKDYQQKMAQGLYEGILTYFEVVQ